MWLRPWLLFNGTADSHERAAFTCGVESLDRNLQSHAGPDVRRRANGRFVLTDKPAPDRVLVHYTLCATALPPSEVLNGYVVGQ